MAQKPKCISTFMCFGSHRFAGEVHRAWHSEVLMDGAVLLLRLNFSDAVSSLSRIIMDEAALHLSDKCNTVTINLNRGEFKTHSGVEDCC